MSTNPLPPLAAIIIAGVLVVAVFTTVSNRITASPHPNAQQAAASQIPSVADAQKCTDEADSFYQREGSRLARRGTTRGYIDQYSPRLGKCFITVIASEYSGSPGAFSYYKMSIYDAGAGTPYASYTSSKPPGQPELVSECWVTLDSGQNYHCGTQAEWKKAAAEYQ